MAFPTSPINGQTAVVNNITYTYSTATNSWTRTPSGFVNINASGNVTAGGNIQGNLIIGNGYYLTNINSANIVGSYGDANVTALLNTGLSGNVIPSANNVYNLGSPTNQWAELYLSGNSVYFNGTALSGNATTLTYGGNAVIVANSAGSISIVGNVTANYIIGNGSLLTSLNGANVTGTVANATYAVSAGTAGTVTTNAQPNITSTGTLTSLSVSGNAQLGNVSTAGFVSATGNLTAGNLLINSNANILGNLNVQGNVTFVNSNVITVNDLYIELANNQTTYANINGAGLNVGQTGNVLTNWTYNYTSNAWTTNVGVSATGNISGNYIIGNGALLTNINASNIVGAYSNANVAAYLPTYSGNITAGNISVTGNVTANYHIGNGATLSSITGANVTGTVANATYALSAGSAVGTAATVTTNAQPNITSVGTLTSLSVTGNTQSGNLLTAGLISATGTITGGNVVVPPYGAVLANTITMSGNANIVPQLQVGSALNSNGLIQIYNGSSFNVIRLDGSDSSISATGNIIGGNIFTAGSISATGNVTANYHIGNGATLSSITGANVTGTVANATYATSAGTATSATTAGTVTTNAQPNITSVGTLTSLTSTGLISTTGNISGNYILGNGSQLTGIITSVSNVVNGGSNLNIGAANANVTISVSTVGNVAVFTPTGVSVLGTVTANGNVTGGNINTAGLVSATGNLVGGNITTAGLVSATGNVTGNYIIGNGSQLTSITGANVTGTVANATYALSAGSAVGTAATVTTNAQPNITSVGTLTSLTSTGLISTTGNVSANYVIGNGSLLSSITGANVTGTVANATYALSAGSAVGTAATVTTNAQPNITSVGTLTSLSVSGNATSGNILTAGLISATGNVTGNYFIGNGSQLTGVTASGVAANALTGNTLSSNVIYSSLTTVGTLANLSVAGNTTSGNLLTGGLLSVSGTITSGGNISAGNVTTTGLVSATGNATVGNLTTGGQVTALGNVTGGNINTAGIVSATGNIYGNNLVINNIESVTGNISGGNILTTGQVSATGNVSGGNVNTTVVNSTSTLTLGALSGITLSSVGNINVSNSVINNLGAPVNNNDAATKLYVDTVAQGLSAKASANAASTTSISPYTYSQGNAGIGATLVASSNGALILDTIAVTANARVLIKNEVGNYVNNTTQSAAFNGIYLVTQTGNATAPYILTRTTDDDTSSQIPDAFIFIEQGATQADTGWVCLTDPPVTVGITSISWTQFSGAGSYTANTSAGLSLTGTVFSAQVDGVTTTFDTNGNIIVKASANLTTPNIGNATGNSLVVSGNGLIQGTNLSATANIIAGNVNTAGLVSATGNIIGGNITTAGLVSATGTITSGANITGGNILTSGLVSVTGTITSGGNITSGNILSAGLISTTGNAIHGNVTTAGLISATGNITGNYIIGNGSQLTSITGANVTGQVANALIAGTVYTNAQPNITSVGTLSSLSVSGNATSGNLLSAGLISVTGNATAGNITTAGLISATGNVTGNYFIGNGSQLTGVAASSVNANALVGNTLSSNVTISSLTTVGTLSSLSVAGNTQTGNLLTAGIVSATGNVTGNYILGNGAFLTGVITSVANINNGTSNVSIASANANVTVGVSGVGNIAVFATTGEYVTGLVSATGNLYGNHVLATLSVSAGANIRANLGVYGNGIYSSGDMTATGNISVTGNISAAGNIFGGGVNSTTSATPPSSPSVGDFWYNTTTNVQYRYTFDGTSYFWLDDYGSSAGVNGTFNAITNGTSNVNISTANANIAVTVNNTPNVVVWATTGEYVTGVISASGNISAPYFLGNVIGNISGNLIVPGANTQVLYNLNGDAGASAGFTFNQASNAMTVSGNITANNLSLTGNIIPSAANTYTLGNATNTWQEVYVGPSSLYIGGNALSAVNGVLSFNGANVVTTTTPTGNISVTGNITANYYIGNGSLLTSLTGANVTGTVANATYALSAGSAVGTAATVTTNAQPNITSVGTLSSLTSTGLISTTGNVSANYVIGNGSLLTSLTGANITGTVANATYALSAGSAVGTAATVTTNAQPNITSVGTLTSVTSSGTISTTGSVLAATLSASGSVYGTVFSGKATTAQYADLAENYVADADYEPGTVVIFGGEKEITVTDVHQDTRMAGIISTNPAYLMNSTIDGLPVALTGRVPCKVVGAIRKGDRLVSSGIKGVATVLDPTKYQPGCIIGKALEDYDSDKVGVIEVAVGRY